MPSERTPDPQRDTGDAWRDRWEGPHFILWHESEAAYFHALWDEVSRRRDRRGRHYGTSPVEAAVINAMDEGSSFNHR